MQRYRQWLDDMEDLKVHKPRRKQARLHENACLSMPATMHQSGLWGRRLIQIIEKRFALHKETKTRKLPRKKQDTVLLNADSESSIFKNVQGVVSFVYFDATSLPAEMSSVMDMIDPAEAQMHIPPVPDETYGFQMGGASQGEASIPSQIDKSPRDISLIKLTERTTIGYVLPFLLQ